jgi:metallo-beta-lactamase class B
LKWIVAGASLTVLAATMALAQDTAPRGAGRGGAGQDANTPTEAQWNTPEAQAYVTKAKELAGNDPDLQFDENFNCTPGGTHAAGGGGDGGGDSAASGNTGIPYVASPRPAQWLPPQHVLDNLWWFGDTGVGSWLVTSKDGYLLFDTLNDADEEQSVLLDGMKKVGLDPKKIKYVVIGHFHLDHTGGGHLIQTTFPNVPIYMGRDDWPLYFKSMASSEGQGGRIKDKTPMTRGKDAEDGMVLTIGDTKIAFYSMPGHTPGSTGFIFNGKYQGKTHPVLIITASAGGNNVRNRESFIGGYEHIWNAAEKAKVESVMQSHPNYNQNTLSRMEYLTAHYPLAKNPMLYGAAKDRKYIEITRACAQARLAALGW